MSTNLYLNATTATGAKPSVKQATTGITQWIVDSAEAITCKDMTVDIGSSPSYNAQDLTEPGSNHWVWFGAWISPPLAAQTLPSSQVVSFSADMNEGSGQHNMNGAVCVYVWKYDNSGVRGYIYATMGAFVAGIESDTDYDTVQEFINGLSSQVVCQAGDRIVIEVGAYDTNTKTSSYTHGLAYDGPSGYNDTRLYLGYDVQWYSVGEVGKALIVKYKLRGYVSETQTGKYRIREYADVVKTINYRIRDFVIPPPFTAKYRIRNFVDKLKTFKYVIYGKVLVSSLLEVKYKIRGFVGTDKTHLYRIRGFISTTKTAIYRIRGFIDALKTIKYRIREFISTTQTGEYKIRGFISGLQTALYRIRGYVSSTQTAKYRIRSFVDVLKTAKYRIREFVGTTQTAKYKIRNFVAKVKTFLYKIISEFQTVSALLTAKYKIRGYVGDTITSEYRIRGFISDTLTANYRIRSFISSLKTMKYRILGFVDSVVTAKYKIRNFVGRVGTFLYAIISEITYVSSLLVANYRIRGYVAKSQTSKYRIRTFISKAGAFRYRILEFVSPPAKVFKYKIRGFIGSVFVGKYRIRNFISKVGTFIYSIGGALVVTLTSIYRIRAFVSTDQTAKYRILKFVSPESKVFKYRIRGFVGSAFTAKYRMVAYVSAVKTFLYKILGYEMVLDPYYQLFNELEDLVETQTGVGGDFEGFIVYRHRPKVKPMFFPCIVLDMDTSDYRQNYGGDYMEGAVVKVEVIFKKDHLKMHDFGDGRQLILMRRELARYYRDRMVSLLKTYQPSIIKLGAANISGLTYAPLRPRQSLYGAVVVFSATFKGGDDWSE